MVAQANNAALKCNAVESGKKQYYTLLPHQSVIIGRDSACQIVLDPIHYKGVSRRHAELIPIASTNQSVQWQIHDLGSANGIFINGHQIHEARFLENGDRISLGRNGIEFIFELQTAHSFVPSHPPVAATLYDNHSTSAKDSNLLTSKAKETSGKALAGLVGVIALFLFLNSPLSQQRSQDPPSQSATNPQSAPQASSDPELSNVEFQGANLITQYFNVASEKFIEDVPIKTSDGREVKVDVYGFAVEAKSTFSNSDVTFVVHFYDEAGNEISQPTQIEYDPKPNRWEPGTQAVAVFVLPSERNRLKVIRISR